ncbi:MAG: hypothetical protein HQL68_05225 [Magnetococcales bacterium]|nr:hypothetical protein [Magnetococcales bacterium]
MYQPTQRDKEILMRTFVLTFLIFLLSSIPIFAVADGQLLSETLVARQKSLDEANLLLSQGKNNLEILTIEQKKRLAELRLNNVDLNLIEQGRLDLEAAHMGVESADVDLQSLVDIIKTEETAIQQLHRQVQTLKSTTGENAELARKEQLPNLEAELTNKEKLLNLEKKTFSHNPGITQAG